MITDYKTTIDGLEIYYRTSGNPENQHLVFLHGWAARLDGSLGCDKVIFELAKYFYVVAAEHPGLIRSTPPKAIWGMDDFAHILNKLLTPLNLKNPIVMGQSFGGGVATAYAKLYPQEIRFLILVDAITTKRKRNFFQKLKFIWWPAFSFLVKSKWIPLTLKKVLINISLGVPTKMISKLNAESYSVMGEIPLSERYYLNLDYKSLAMPLFLIWGDRDTWVTPVQRAKEIHSEVKESKLLILKGPHTILYKNPKYAVGEIIKLLPQYRNYV